MAIKQTRNMSFNQIKVTKIGVMNSPNYGFYVLTSMMLVGVIF